MLFHGIMIEKGSQKQTIHTLEPTTVFCQTFKSHLVLRGAGVCQVGKNISYHHCRLSGQFGLSVDINPYISSFSQYLVIYTATTTRTPTTRYIAFHTWRHQRRTLLENGHKNQDLKYSDKLMDIWPSLLHNTHCWPNSFSVDVVEGTPLLCGRWGLWCSVLCIHEWFSIAFKYLPRTEWSC